VADILIVEDNRELSGLLCDFLKGERYSVAVAESGEQALAIYNREGVKLVILDIMLPGMDGFAVCKKIRSGGNTPILIVSAKTAKEDKLNGLLQGADDYIEKPYDIDIMLAKIDGIFKRRYAFDTLSDGELFVNRAARTVTKGGREIEMRAKEFDLLVLLLENRGRALDKEYIFEQIWGSDSFSEPQTLTVHIKWLREKIEENPKHPQKILTVWGVGYRYL
jgi:DNA-binding response OmpR family regulator